MIISFTGHRKLGNSYKSSNPVYLYVQNEIKEYLASKNVTKIISGMAVGTDQLAAKVATEMGIPFIAAVPFVGQESKWPSQVQKEYKELLSKAEEVVIVSEGSYAAYKMQVRNEWMVDHSDLIIAVWDETLRGGTFNCVCYAIKMKKQTHIINPNNYK